jgi:hypothetical protein
MKFICSSLGWENQSWGYHGDDGHSFSCSGVGRAFGPTYSTGDIIGCGINFMTREGFYTKNGVFIGKSILFRCLCNIVIDSSLFIYT